MNLVERLRGYKASPRHAENLCGDAADRIEALEQELYDYAKTLTARDNKIAELERERDIYQESAENWKENYEALKAERDDILGQATLDQLRLKELKAQVGEPFTTFTVDDGEIDFTGKFNGTIADTLPDGEYDLYLHSTTERRVPTPSERKAAEQEYTISAFDYPQNPVGSRDWCLFWAGWRAAFNAAPALTKE